MTEGLSQGVVKQAENPATTAVKACSRSRMFRKSWVEHIAKNQLQVAKTFRSQLTPSTEALEAPRWPGFTSHD